MRTLTLAALVFACAVRTSAASPIVFSETVSGDLGEGFPAQLFTLDVGVNTISGNTHVLFELPFNFSVDFDDFAITIPAGLELGGITYAFVPVVTPGTTSATSEYQLGAGNTSPSPPLASATIDFQGPLLVFPFASALPLGAGTYAVNQSQMSGAGEGLVGFSADYTWAFTVRQLAEDPVPVPEPASLFLLASGLLAGARRWRRRT